MKRSCNCTDWQRFVFAFVVILAVVSFALYFSTNMFIPSRDYQLSIEINYLNSSGLKEERTVADNFSITYDFSKQEGVLQFVLPCDCTIEQLSLSPSFPISISNATILQSVSGQELPLEMYQHAGGIKNYQNTTNAVYSSFKVSFTANDRIKIVFKPESDILPNGRYNFLLQNNILLNPPINKGNIILIPGSKYECLTPCLKIPLDEENSLTESKIRYGKDIHLSFILDQKTSSISTRNNVFYINMYSFYKEKLAQFYLLLSGIFLTLFIEQLRRAR